MKLNCTYELLEPTAFCNIAGAESSNTQWVKFISNHGHSIRVSHIDGAGSVTGVIAADGTKYGQHYTEKCGQYISTSEFKYFRKIKEGYPERVESMNFPTVTLTITNREQAQKAISALQELLK